MAKVQTEREQADAEATSLRIKFDTMEKSLKELKKKRRKKVKGQMHTMLDTAEAETESLGKRLHVVEGELAAARDKLAVSNCSAREAETKLQDVNAELARQVASLEAAVQTKQKGAMADVARMAKELEELKRHDFESKAKAAQQTVCLTTMRGKKSFRTLTCSMQVHWQCALCISRVSVHCSLRCDARRGQAQRTPGVDVQAEAAKLELQERNERIKRTEAEMQAVMKELSEKSSALHEAKSAVAALKEQVKHQLQELAATSALLPCPAAPKTGYWPRGRTVLMLSKLAANLPLLLCTIFSTGQWASGRTGFDI
jgi:chromosome segregation ATPase